MFRFSDWPCSGAARLTFRTRITAPGRAVFRLRNASCPTHSAHPVRHVTPFVRNDQTATMSTSRLRIRCRRDGVANGRTRWQSRTARRPRYGSQAAEDTNVSAPDTIAKLIRGVVFLAGNDWHRAGLPGHRAMIRQQLGDRARNQEWSASALARRYMASRAADSASSRAACAKSIASKA